MPATRERASRKKPAEKPPETPAEKPPETPAETPAGTTGEKSRTAATPWGPATVLEEAMVPQRAGERRFALVAELLETRDGERLVRLAYATDGPADRRRARRGPVTMRARDIERLRAALGRAPALAEALRV